MKKLFKIGLIFFILFLLFVPSIARAETLKSEVDQTTEYISEETKNVVSQLVQIKEGYQKFVVMEVVLLLFAVILIWKTSAIGTSTKVFIMIAVLGLFAYVLRFSIDGTVIKFLDIFIQALGVIIILMANVFIFKHDNLLIYVPVYILGMAYCFNYLSFVKDNVMCKALLVAAPIILYVLGYLKQKSDEKIFMKPVEIKHDKKD